MDFLVASSPETSSSSSSDSYSPSILSSELGLDPSDPLNILLRNNNADHTSSSSQDGESPPDWSTLSALWPEASSVTSNDQQKLFAADMLDLSDIVSFPMDMDFNPSIDPSALHFNPHTSGIHIPTNFAYPTATPQDIFQQQQQQGEALAPPFSFSFLPNTSYDSGSQSDTASETSSTKDNARRLSIGSSVSSPSTSSVPPFSPLPENVPSPASVTDSINSATFAQLLANMNAAAALNSANSNSPSSNEAAAQAIAERVRQMAGVVLALPMSAQLQALEQQQQQQNGTFPTTATQVPKLPIPRLPRPSASNPSLKSSSSSAASTPPPSTPSTHSPSPLPSTVSSVQTSPSSQPLVPPAPSRPKTSHTTIERRYRTNLNARIQSLRMAVPALRVVEDRENITGSGKKKAPNKVLVSSAIPGASSPPPGGGGTVINTNGIIDIIDERGYVDGVKVARKCSKANVLGKAVEYIKVLKRRELRLRNEQAGLRALIGGLVGGPALLREWEREWKNRFGGQEQDEVNPDEQEGDDEDEDEAEGDEDEDEAGRKRKRGKVTPTPSAVKAEKKKSVAAPMPSTLPDTSAAAAPAPERRKRGRPRKVVPLTSEEDNKMDVFPTGVPQQEVQGQQYLLAVFAMFSFLNSPLTSSTSSWTSSPPATHHHHAHTGHVLTPPANNQTAVVVGSSAWGLAGYIHMFHLLVSILVLASVVSRWMGVGSGASQAIGKIFKAVRGAHASTKVKKTRKYWVKEAERVVLSGKEATIFEKLQIYYGITSSSPASVSDSITAALVLYPLASISGPVASLARFKARSEWASASKLKGANVYEKMVLSGLTMDEASLRLCSSSFTISKDDDGEHWGPVEILADGLVKANLRKALSLLFVRTVRAVTQDSEDLASSAATIKPGQSDPAYVDPTEREGDGDARQDLEEKDKESLEGEWMGLVEAARELGGDVADMGRAFERAWKVKGECGVEDVEDMFLAFRDDGEGQHDEEEEVVDDEIKSLLTALVLFRKSFSTLESQQDEASSSALLSPPPTPGRPSANGKEIKAMGVLREALGSRVFEEWNLLEDARDRVVDLVVEKERRWIGAGL